MYVFNADGTMQQANPDAGDPHASDSDGKGIWIEEGGHVKGKWMELAANRTTHQFTGRLEITFKIQVEGDRLTGRESVRTFDAEGKETEAPDTPAPITGERLKLP
jgi:hypothetical protein